jgi:hypothetical protein
VKRKVPNTGCAGGSEAWGWHKDRSKTTPPRQMASTLAPWAASPTAPARSLYALPTAPARTRVGGRARGVQLERDDACLPGCRHLARLRVVCQVKGHQGREGRAHGER